MFCTASADRYNGKLRIGRHHNVFQRCTIGQRHQLQTAAFRHDFELANEKRQEAVVAAGQYDFAVGINQRRSIDGNRRQDGFAAVYGHDHFTRFHASDHIAQLGDEAVAATA